MLEGVVVEAMASSKLTLQRVFHVVINFIDNLVNNGILDISLPILDCDQLLLNLVDFLHELLVLYLVVTVLGFGVCMGRGVWFAGVWVSSEAWMC